MVQPSFTMDVVSGSAAVRASPMSIAGDGEEVADTERCKLERSHQCVRQAVVGSSQITARDGASCVGAECGELECNHQCM